MAHFSLGGAYTQAGRHADAARSYLRCTELNPDMSKAYQLAGAAYLEAGDKQKAGEVLTEGIRCPRSRRRPDADDRDGRPLRKARAPGAQGGSQAGRAVLGRIPSCARGRGDPATAWCARPSVAPWVSGSSGTSRKRRSTTGSSKAPRSSTSFGWTFRASRTRRPTTSTWCEYLGIDEALFTQLTGKH